MNDNVLSKNFSTGDILRYVCPTILMMIFMSSYTIVDGMFVSNLVGEDALSAVNLVMPIIGVLLAVGLMLGTGAVSVIGKLMGEGDYKKARGFLTTIYIIGIVLGVAFTALGFIFEDNIVAILTKDDTMIPLVRDYYRSLLPFATTMFLQVFVQTFFVTAGKPALGFIVCVMGGIINIILDYVFISPKLFDLGIAGAGLATGIGNLVPAFFGLVYFAVMRKGSLFFTKPYLKIKVILQSMYNGSSEMVSNLSIAITTMLFNVIMMNIIGKSGVAAISVILYVQMFQMAFYMGYSMGIAPVLSYKYGEQTHKQLANIVKISLYTISIISAVVVAVSLLFSEQAISIFLKKESETFFLAKEGFLIFSISYLFMGLNVFICAMFTAFSNGRVSASLSVIRTLVFTVAALLILPELFGIIGVWLAVPVAEFLALCVSLYYFIKYKKVYKY